MEAQAAAPTIDQIIATARPRRESVRLSLRWDLVEQHRDSLIALQAAIEHDESSNWPVEQQQRHAAAEVVVALEQQLRDTEVEFIFESLGWIPWSKLLAEHPPTPEERKAGLDCNMLTFPPAAIAASCVRPTMSVDQVVALFNSPGMTISTFDRLWATCLAANRSAQRPGESQAASAVLQRSRPSSEPPEPTESPAAS